MVLIISRFFLADNRLMYKMQPLGKNIPEQEMISMKDTTALHKKLISFLLATTIIFCGSTIYYAVSLSTANRGISHGYQQSLNQLMESMSSINTALDKTAYSEDGAMLSTLAAEIWVQSEAAKMAMAALPLSDTCLEACETFIAQAGDYAYYLLRSNAYGAPTEDGAWGTLSSLSDTSASLYDQLAVIKEKVDSGVISFQQRSRDTQALSGSFSEIESQFPEYAKLVYDGPFSQHIQNRSPLFLEGAAQVSEAEALTAAAAGLGVESTVLALDYTAEGVIPCYCFTAGTSSVFVTKAGGKVLSILDTRSYGTAQLDAQGAVQAAADYLAAQGYANMKTSYYTTYENVVTINFAATQDGTVLYPDLIQVGIALDTGAVVRLDATGYFMNHKARTQESPAISQQDARKSLPAGLQVDSENLAIIPTAGKQERLCYEFVCTAESGRHLLYYVDCKSGKTENMLILIETEAGTLTA